MATEVGDIVCIKDEDVLRRMWQNTEDFARKKQIRAHMYKLREQRLKEFYTTGEVLSDVQSVTPETSQATAKSDPVQNITKYSDTGAMTLTDSIEDQGFMAMKSREIRDAESPTRILELSQNSNANNAQTSWKVESSSDSYHAVGSGGQYEVTSQSQRRSMAGENDRVISDVATSSGSRTIQDREGNRTMADGNNLLSSDVAGDGLNSCRKLNSGDSVICTSDDASRAVTVDGKVTSTHQSSVRSQQSQAWSSSTSKSSTSKVSSSSYSTAVQNLSDKDVGDVWIEEGPGGVTRTVRVVKKFEDQGDQGGVTRITRIIKTSGSSGDYVDNEASGITAVTVEKTVGKESLFQDNKTHGNSSASNIVSSNEDYRMEEHSGGAQRVITKIIRTSGIEKDGRYVVEDSSGGTVVTEKIVRTAGRSADDMQRVNEESVYKYEERKTQGAEHKADDVTEVKRTMTNRDGRTPDDGITATSKGLLQRNEQIVSHTSSAEERRRKTTEIERQAFVTQSGKTVTETVTSDRQIKEKPSLRPEVVDVTEKQFEDDRSVSMQSRRESTHLETEKMKSEFTLKEETDRKIKSDVEKSEKMVQVKEHIPHPKPGEYLEKTARTTQRGDITHEMETTKISRDESERKIALSQETTDIPRSATDKVPERNEKPMAMQNKREDTQKIMIERELIKDDRTTEKNALATVTIPSAVPKDREAKDTPIGKQPQGTDVSETQPEREHGKGRKPETFEDDKNAKKDLSKPGNIPTDNKPGSYTTTYQWSFTPQKINVEVSASHAAFASSLRAPSLSPERGFLPYRSSSDVTYTCGRKSPAKSTSRSSLERTTPTPRKSYSPELRKNSRTSPVKTPKSPTQDHGRKPTRKGSEPRSVSPKSKVTPVTIDGRPAVKTPKDSKTLTKDKRKLSGTRRRSGTPGVSPSTSPERDGTKPGKTRTTSSSSESSRLTYNRDIKIATEEKYSGVTDFIKKEREDRETKKILRAPGVDRLREKSPEYSSDGSLAQELYPDKSSSQPSSVSYPKDNAFTPIRPYDSQTSSKPRRPSTSSSPSTSPERKGTHTLGTLHQKQTRRMPSDDVGTKKSPSRQQSGKIEPVTPDKRTQPKTKLQDNTNKSSAPKSQDLERPTAKPNDITSGQKKVKPERITPDKQPKQYVTPDGRKVIRTENQTKEEYGQEDYENTQKDITKRPNAYTNQKPRDESKPTQKKDDYDVTPDGIRVPRKPGTRPGDEPDDYKVTPDGRKVMKKPGTRPGDKPDDYDETPDGRRVPRKPGTRPGDELDDYDETPDGRRVPRKPGTRPGDEPEDYKVTPDGRKVPRKPGTRPGDEPDDYYVTPDGRRVPRKPGTRPGDEPEDYDVTPDGRRVPRKPGTRPGDEPEDYDVTPDGRRVPREPGTRPGDEPEDYDVTPDGRKVMKKPGTRPGDKPDDYDVTPDGRKVPRQPGTKPGDLPDDYKVTPDGRRVPRKPGTRPGDEPEDYDVTPDGRRVPRKPGTRPGDKPDDYDVTPDGRKVPRKPGTRPRDEPEDYDVTPDGRRVPRKPGTRPGDEPEDYDVTPDGRRVPRKPGTRPGDEPEDYEVTPDGRKVPRQPGTKPGDLPDDYKVTPDGRKVPRKPGTRPGDEPDDYYVTPDGRRVPRKPGTRPGDEPEDYDVTPDGKRVPRKPGTRPGDEPDDYHVTPDGRKVPRQPGTKPGDLPDDYKVTPDGRRVPRKPGTRPGDEPEDYDVTPDGRKVPRQPGTKPGDLPDDYKVTPDGRKVMKKPGTRPGDKPDDYDVTPDGRRVPRKPGTRPGDEPEDYDVTPDGRKVPRQPGTKPGDLPDDYKVTPDGRKVPRKPGTRPGDEPDDYYVTPDGRRVPGKPGTRPGDEPEDYDVTPDGRRVPRKPGTRPGDEPEDYDVTPDGRRVPREPGTRPGDEPEDYDVTPDGRRVPREPGTRPGDELDDYDETPDGRRVPRKPGTRPGDEPEDYRVTPDGRRVPRKPGTRPGDEPEDYHVTPDGRRVPRKPVTGPGDEPEDYDVTPDGRRVPREPGTRPGDEPEDYDVTPDGRRVPRKPGARPGDEPEDYDVTPDGRRVPREPGTRPGDEPDDYDVTPDGRRVPRKPGTRPGDEPDDYKVTPDGRKVMKKPGTRPGDKPDDYDVTPDGRRVPRKPVTGPGDEPDDYDVTPDGRKVPRQPGTKPGDLPDDYKVTPDGRRVPRKPGTRPGDEPEDYDETPDGRRVPRMPGTRPGDEPEDYRVTPDGRKVPRKPGTRPGDEPDDYYVTPDGRRVPRKPGTRPGDESDDYYVTPDGRKVPRKPGTRPGDEPEDYDLTPDGRRVPRKPGTRPVDEPDDYHVTPDGRRVPRKPSSRPGEERNHMKVTPDGRRVGRKPDDTEINTSVRRTLTKADKSVTKTTEKSPKYPGSDSNNVLSRRVSGKSIYEVPRAINPSNDRQISKKKPTAMPDFKESVTSKRVMSKKFQGYEVSEERHSEFIVRDYDYEPDGVHATPEERSDLEEYGLVDNDTVPEGREDILRRPSYEDEYPDEEPLFDNTTDDRKVHSKPSDRAPKHEYVTPDGRKVIGKRPTTGSDVRTTGITSKTPATKLGDRYPGTIPEKKIVSRPGTRHPEPNKTVPGKRVPGHEYVTFDGRTVPSKKPVGKYVPTTPDKKPITSRLASAPKTSSGTPTRTTGTPITKKPERGYASPTMASLVRKPSDSAKTPVQYPKESTEPKRKAPVSPSKPTKKLGNEPRFEDEPRRRSTTSATDFTSERHLEVRQHRTTRTEYEYDDEQLKEYPVDNEQEYLEPDRARKQPKSTRATSGPILKPKQEIKTPTKKILPQQKSEPKMRTTHGTTPKSKMPSSPLRKEPERPSGKSKPLPKRTKRPDSETSGEEDGTDFVKETMYSDQKEYTLTEQQRVRVRSKGTPEKEGRLKEPKGVIEFPESPREPSPERPRFTPVDDKRVEELRPRYPDSVTEAEDESDDDYPQRRIKSKPETLTEEEDEHRRKKHKKSPERGEPVDSEDETKVSVAKRVNKFMDAARKAGSSPLPSRPEDITLKGLDDTINSYMESNDIDEDTDSVNAVRKAKTMFENIAYSQLNTTARREIQRQDDILDRPSVFDARRKDNKPDTEPSDDEGRAPKRVPTSTQERKPIEPEVLRRENLLKLGIRCSEDIFNRDIFEKTEPGKDTFPRRKTPSPERPVGKFDTFPTRKSPLKDDVIETPRKSVTPERAKSPPKGRKTEEPQTPKLTSKPSDTKPVTSRYPFSKPKPEVKPETQKPLKSTSVTNRYPFSDKPREPDRPQVNGYVSPENRYGKQPSARIPEGTDLKSPALLKEPLKQKRKEPYDEEYPGYDAPRGKESSPAYRRPADSYPTDKDGSYPRPDSPKKGYNFRSPVRDEKSPSPNRAPRGDSRSLGSSLPRDRGYPFDEPRDVKDRSPTGRRGSESPGRRAGRRGSPDSRSPSDRRESPSRHYPREKSPLDARDYPGSRSPTGRRRDYPDDRAMRSPSPDSKRPGSPRKYSRPADLPDESPSKARRPSGKTYPEEGRPIFKSPTRKNRADDDTEKYRRPSSDNVYENYPDGRSKPREGSPRITDEVTVSKFGVSLKKTTTGSSIMKKVFADVGRKESELDRIFDLEVLETLLERAKGYDERRLIRQQIRLVKKMIENGELPEQPTRKRSEPDVYDTVTPSRDTDSPHSKPKKDDRRESFGRSSKSPEKKVPDRRSPEKQQPGRYQPVDSVRRRSEDKHYSTEVRRQSSEHFTSSVEFKRSTPSKPSDILNKTMKKSYIDDEQREESLTDSITSSYGIGPTDEKGMPLFGLKALRRQNKTTQEVEPNFVPFEEEPSPRDIKDSSGRPLFGLKALQISKSPTRNVEEKPVSESNDRPLVKDILNKRDKQARGNAVSQPQQHAPSRFRDTFAQNRNEEFIRRESEAEDVKHVIKDRGQSLKSMIQRHESLTESDKKRPESVTTSSSFTSSTVVRSSAVRKADGGISVKSHVVQGETISKDGEKPKSRVVTAEYSYETPERGYDEFGNETISDEEYRTRETTRSTSKSIKSRSNTSESIISRSSRRSLSPERKPVDDWPADDSTARTRRPISDKLSQLSRKFSNEPEDLARKSEPRTEPHYTSHTSSSLLHSNAFSSITTTHTDRNISSRYQPDDETSPGRRRSATPQDDTSAINRRRSSTPLDELKESLFRKSSVTHEETDSSSTLFTRYGRGGAVKALSQKFQQPRAEAESPKNTASYPKAGLILRSASFKHTNGDLTPPDSPAYKQSVSLEARVGSPTRSGNSTPRLGHESKFVESNERVTEGSRRWSRDGENDFDGYSQTSRRVTTSVTETTDGKSFLGSNTKVTGVKDIISRMKAADIDDVGLESPEDIQARSLLNKFLGASVMMSGMEPLVSASGNSSASLVSQVERQRILQSSPGETFGNKSYVIGESLKDYGDIDNIWDEKKLRQLLDACTDYEGRRKIRARLRTVMAEKSACEDLVSAAQEEESLKFGDGSKSVQAGESLLPYLVEKLRTSLLLESLPSQKTEEGLSVTHMEDSGTESGEDLRLLVGLRDSICEGSDVKKSEQLKLNAKLLTEVQEALQKLEISLNSRADNSLDPITRETLLQLITRLQSSLKMAPGIAHNFETKSPGRNRFANRRLARQNRHTVGVTQEELADARRLIQENSLTGSGPAFNGSGQGEFLPKSENVNQTGPDQFVASYAVVKQNSADDVTSNASSAPVKLFRPVHFNPGKSKLPVQSCNAPPKPFLSSEQIQSADQWVRSQIGNTRRLSEGCSVPNPNYSVPTCFSPPTTNTNSDVPTCALTETKPDSLNLTAPDKNEQTRETNFNKPPSPPYKNIQYSPSILNPFEAAVKTEPEDPKSPTHPVQGLAHSKSVSNNIQNIRPRSPIKHSLSTDNGDSVLEYDPSLRLFTPEQSVKIAVHKAAINKQLSQEEEKRMRKMSVESDIGSTEDEAMEEDGDISSVSEDEDESTIKLGKIGKTYPTSQMNGQKARRQNFGFQSQVSDHKASDLDYNCVDNLNHYKHYDAKDYGKHFSRTPSDEGKKNADKESLNRFEKRIQEIQNERKTGNRQNVRSIEELQKIYLDRKEKYNERKVNPDSKSQIIQDVQAKYQKSLRDQVSNQRSCYPQRLNPEIRSKYESEIRKITENGIRSRPIWNEDENCRRRKDTLKSAEYITALEQNYYNPPQTPMDVSQTDSEISLSSTSTESSFSHAQRLLRLATGDKSNKSSKKVKMKRANTIDIPKPLNYYDVDNYSDYTDDEQKSNTYSSTVKAMKPSVPNLEPKTESDKKFLAFLRQQNQPKVSNTIWSKDHEPHRGNPFAEHQWGNRFSRIKTTFENVDDKNERPVKKLSTPSSVTGARAFWKTADDSAAVIKSPKDTLSVADRPKLTRQGSMLLKKLFQEKEAEEKPTRLPWTSQKENVVVGSLTVYPQRNDATTNINKPNTNQFSHAPMSAFRPVERKADAAKTYHGPAAKFAKPIPVIPNKVDSGPSLPWLRDKSADKTLNTTVAKFENLSSRETSPTLVPHREKFLDKTNFVPTYQDQHIPPRLLLPVQSNVVHTRSQAFSSNYPHVKCDMNPVSKTDPRQCTEIPPKTEFFHPVTTYSVDVATTSTVYPEAEPEKADGFELLTDSAVSTPEEQMAVIKVMGGPVQQHAVTITQKTHRRNDENENRTTAAKSLTNMLQRFSSPPSDKSPEHLRTRGSVPDVNYSRSSLLPPNLPTGKTSPTSPGNRSVSPLCGEDKLTVKSSQLARPSSAESLALSNSSEELGENCDSVTTSRLQIPLSPGQYRTSSLQDLSPQGSPHQFLVQTASPPIGALRKSESCHQLNVQKPKRPQSLILPDLPAPQRRTPTSLTKTKSSHALSFPKQFEAVINPAAVEMKQRTVQEFFAVKKRTKKEAQTNFVELDDNLENVDEAFDALFSSVSSGSVSAKKTHKSDVNDGYRPRNQISKSISSSAIQQIRNVNTSSSVTTTTTKSSDGGYSKISSERSVFSTVGTAKAASTNKPISPFAKFQQLDRQNSGSSSTPSSPSAGKAPLFTFTDPKLSRSASGVKDRLLQWCQLKTKNYKNIQIENFSTSWSNGLAFCALIHHFRPEAFDYDALTPKERRKNFELAFKVAEEEAGIAPLLDVDDMVMMKKPDWKCVFTYVQSIYCRFKNED